ncbi:hypothetical protein [Streptomyces sp. NPDC094149]|uniref:hypothetical protein n=1 Tax=Streptomyces sp. NPDC094149 TaxID=3155079 RepID=UPI00332AA405
MTTAVREAPHHNTLTCYVNYGCRLPECVERKNEWARERTQRMRAGTWQPHVDANPAREHVRQLTEAGITIEAIARAASVCRDTIADLTDQRRAGRRRPHGISPEIAARILALTPDTIDPGRVEAIGTHRRIQALVAAGWPLLHIGIQLGMNRQRPDQILREQRVYAATRDRIAEGYPRLVNLRPERNGVPKHKARYAREMAKGNRWAPPKYWATRMDDIDDPHFEPLYGIGKGALLAADARELMKWGVSVEQIAHRLGVTKAHLYQELLRHPEAEPAIDAGLAA